ncbi:MAG: type IV pilus biogenesis/stability protein PilW [Pseudomonadota bacterium]
MSRTLIALLTLSVIVLGGCSSEPVRDGVDTTKAAEANARLGLRYMQQGNYEVALQKFNKALSFDNRYAPAHHYLAELYRRLDQYEKADEHYRDALYYSEDDSSLSNNYGAFLCSRERYDDGEKQFLNVLKNPVYPRKDQVYENLGLCVERKPNAERAEEYLRSALRINPRLPKSLLAMARLSFSKGNYLSTRAYLQRYLDVARHTAETLWLGIRAERLLGDNNAVSSYALLLKANFPDAPETKLYLESGD